MVIADRPPPVGSAPVGSAPVGSAPVGSPPRGTGEGPRVGVLSVQGAVHAHARVLRRLGARPVAVRTPADLAGLAGVVLPGGESTAMTLLMKANGLWSALADFLAARPPVLATCAGAIIVATELRDGRPDQDTLGIVELSVRRNGFGRQVHSFETAVRVTSGERLPAVFIRAPVIERVGPEVEVLAELPVGGPVLCRQGNAVVATFHPELTGDSWVHAAAFGALTGSVVGGG
jgi:pyridoxal 5'-phosphate synthase pdxT subunit